MGWSSPEAAARYNRSYYLKNKKRRDAYRRKWAKANPEKESKYKSTWLSKNHKKIYDWEKKRPPIIRKAYWTIRNAIRSKKFIKKPCEKCGNKKSHAHHSDYSKPLDVNWLCPLHHKEIHRISSPII